MNWRLTSIVLAITVVLLLTYLVASTRHENQPDQSQPDAWSIGPGFVRTRRVIANSNTAEILFETDNGRVYQFGVCNNGLLPVWEGMHATLQMRGCQLLYAEHLPPDIPVEKK